LRQCSKQKMSYILVVDDDEAIGRMIALILQTEGVIAKIAHTAEEAFAEIGLEKPLLVILDYLLPGVDTPGFVQKFGELGYKGKVLLCTAAEGDLDVITDGLLRKPFKPEDLARAVRELIP
jgi:DNA-binding response OmpR family regulator